ncbi:MAG: DUF883 family protein [Verrucomicrobiota bacterium]|jgi:ElaB/YqjD/DUF883 family membrane-anchored ribosome-binding protein
MSTNEKLSDNVQGVMDDAEELMRATSGQTGERITEIRHRLSSAIESTKANLNKLKDKAVEAAKATDHTIREHPYESLGVAFAVGLLIGVLVGRRR